MRLFQTTGRKIVTAGVALALLGAAAALAQSTTNPSDQSPWASPNGPLGTNGTGFGRQGMGPQFGNQSGPMMQNRNGRGYGDAGGGRGFGPQSGIGPGGMAQGRGFGFYARNSGDRIASDKVSTIVAGYLARFTDSSYQATKVLEFQNDFYVQVTDSTKHQLAFELSVNPYTGDVHPAPIGMGWNTSYGRAANTLQGNIGQMTVTQSQATQNATDYVKKVSSTASVSQASSFPGYYSFVVSDAGKIVGVLSVNGYDGQVRYQNWNGAFVKSIQ